MPCPNSHPECATAPYEIDVDGECVCVYRGCPGGVVYMEPCGL